MAGDDQIITPGSGRILGAGGNELQRSIDSLNLTLQRLMMGAGGMGGGGRPPTVIAATPEPGGDRLPVPRNSGIVPRASAFPRAVSWDEPTTTYTVTVGTPVRNTPRSAGAGQPPLPPGGSGSWSPSPYVNPNYRVFKAGGGGGGSASPPLRWRNALRNGATAANRISTWGTAAVKQGTSMDTYAQWAGIQQGSPFGVDGTDGSTVNAIRKYIFGSQNQNLTSWAQSVNDAQAAAFIASRNSGYNVLNPGSTSVNPQFAGYLSNVKDLATLNPTMSAVSLAGMVGTLSSNRALYASWAYGYNPVRKLGGAVPAGAIGQLTDSIIGRTFQGRRTISAKEFTAALGQGESLNANISAYVNSIGGDQSMVQALEDYATGRNTARLHGLSGNQFDTLLSQAEQGGRSGQAAKDQLRKLGISNTIVQSQKDLSASKSQNISDLMDSLGPAVKSATEELGKFYGALDKIVNMPGIKQGAGNLLGWGSVFGSPLATGLGAAAGLRLGGGLPGIAGSLLGMRSIGGTGAITGALGAGSGLGGAAVLGGAALGSGAAIAGGWELGGHVTNSGTSTGLGIALGLGGPVGALALQSSMARRMWDKLNGRNSESWLSTLNPFGHRTTPTTGIGGGTSRAALDSGGSSSSRGTPIAGKTAAGAIQTAMNQIGKDYVYGAEGPDTFDCSGLMQFAYHSIGVNLPRTSQQQMRVGQHVDLKDVRPGDLMFPYPGHVVMALGGGKILEAPHTGAKVRIMPESEYGHYQEIRRIVGAVGTYSGIGSSSATPAQQQTGNAGGNSGAPGAGVGSSLYASSNEVDVLGAALASVRTALNGAPMGNSASSAADPSSTTGSSSVTPSPSGRGAAANKNLAKYMAAYLYGWKGDEWDALNALWMQESGFNEKAKNPSSGAYGIPQALPASKMSSAGSDWKTNPRTQIAWGLKYIKDRYGDPLAAEANEKKFNWYDTGAWEIKQDEIAKVHKGEMIIEKPKADKIRDVLMRDVVNMRDASGSTSSSSHGGGLTLVFNQGAISFSTSGPLTASTAQAFAQSFAERVSQHDRIKKLQRGL